MIVVADTTPFVALINVGEVGVLPGLFGRVVVPGRVIVELQDARRPEGVRAFASEMPSWLVVREPASLRVIEDLDPGETAAISLALDLGANLLLIDDRAGRAAATERGLTTVRTGAVLYEAARAGLITDLAVVFQRLRQTDFRIPEDAVEEILRRWRSERGRKP